MTQISNRMLFSVLVAVMAITIPQAAFAVTVECVNFDGTPSTGAWPNPNNPSELHEFCCQDGEDNDGDGLVDGADVDCQCHSDVAVANGSAAPDCTAGDTKIVLVGLGVLEDGCIATGPGSQDEVALSIMQATVEVGANSRYDLGMYVALDGGDARTGTCSVFHLDPRAATGQTPDQCNPGNPPATTPGPYFDLENDPLDWCGDATKAPPNGSPSEACEPFVYMNWPVAIGFNCNSSTDGFLSIARCGSWDQNAGTTCEGWWDAYSDLNSKCRCEVGLTDIPAPSLAVQCEAWDPNLATPAWSTNAVSYTTTEVSAGVTQQYRLTYTNNCTCTAGIQPEVERCCSAGYVRFPITIDSVNGALTNTFPIATTPDGGAIQQSPLIWNPRNHTPFGTTPNIIGGGETTAYSATGTLNYAINTSTPAGTEIAASFSTEWANDSVFTSAVDQGLNAVCPLVIVRSPDWAAISDVSARAEAGRVRLEWQTGGEIGTRGFNVYRMDEAADRTVRLNESLLPALDNADGGSYTFLDESASASGAQTYRIGEVDNRGNEVLYGPFSVVPRSDDGSDGPGEVFTASPAAPSDRIVAARRTDTPPVGNRRPTNVSQGKIGVEADGIYQVSVEMIADALGMNDTKVRSAIQTGRLSLTLAGEPVMWHAAADHAGIFFYGTAPTNPYSRENVYLIENSRGKQMDEVAAGFGTPDTSRSFRDTVHYEENLLSRSYLASDPGDDYWYWERIVSSLPNHSSKDLNMPVHGLAPTDNPASLTLWSYGLAEVEHRADILLNGASIGEITWNGVGEANAVVSIEQELLTDGDNTVTVTGLSGAFMIDSLDLTYQRRYQASGDRLLMRGDSNRFVTVSGFSNPEIMIYDVTEARYPVRITGLTVSQAPDGGFQTTFRPDRPDTPYFATSVAGAAQTSWVKADRPSSLRTPTLQVDYLILTSRALWNGAHALGKYRSSNLRYLVVDVEDIYDEFNDNQPSPEAISDFIAYASSNWRKPPTYVVLAGAGNYDYKDYLGFGLNHVPPTMVLTPNGLFGSDNHYADIDGDGVPEVAIGRIPALTDEELLAYVAKVRGYEAMPAGEWTSRALIVADNPDHAGDFPVDSELIAAGIPTDYTVERTYLGSPYTIEEARRRVVDGINQGALVLDYVGHGGLQNLASEGIVRMEEVAGLDNGAQVPVVVGLTCYINLFYLPGQQALGAELTIFEAGGAGAVWAPSGLVINPDAVELGQLFTTRLFNARDRALGTIVRQTLADWVSVAGGRRQLTELYTLLGDPAFAVKVGN